MSKVETICVARGQSPEGLPWSLWYPSWLWEVLTAAEKQEVIASQAQRQNAQVTWQIDSFLTPL